MKDKTITPDLFYIQRFGAYVENKLKLSFEEYESPREHEKAVVKKIKAAREAGISSLLEQLLREKL